MNIEDPVTAVSLAVLRPIIVKILDEADAGDGVPYNDLVAVLVSISRPHDGMDSADYVDYVDNLCTAALAKLVADGTVIRSSGTRQGTFRLDPIAMIAGLSQKPELQSEPASGSQQD